MKKYFVIPSLISAFILWFFCLDDSGDNLIIIRLFSFSTAFWCAFGDPKNILSKRTSMKIVIPMMVVMLMYNPFFPIPFGDFDTYVIVNIISGIVLVWCAIQRAKLFSSPKINVDFGIQKIQAENPKLFDQIKTMSDINNFLIASSLDEDSKKIGEIIGLKLAADEITEFVKQVKMVYLITADKSFERISKSIKMNAPVGLTEEECLAVYEVFTGVKTKELLYKDGDGSEEFPLIINTEKSQAGAEAISAWIRQRHGEYNKCWKQTFSACYRKEGEKQYKVITLKTTTGEEYTYHFDISNFFGKW